MNNQAAKNNARGSQIKSTTEHSNNHKNNQVLFERKKQNLDIKNLILVANEQSGLQNELIPSQ